MAATMRDKDNRNRIAGGSPGRPKKGGGRFARETRQATTMQLERANQEGSWSQLLDRQTQVHIERALREVIIPESWRTRLDDDTYAAGFTRDDLVQDTFMDLAKGYYNSKKVPSYGEVARLGRTKVRHIAAKANISAKAGREPHEWAKLSGDRHSGITRFGRERAEIERYLGRPMTRQEQDDLAESIRQSWDDPKRKPPVGFHRREAAVNERLSLSAPIEEGQDTAAEAVLAYGASGVDSLDVTIDSLRNEIILQEYSAEGGFATMSARWEAFAKMSRLPIAPMGHISARESRMIKSKITGNCVRIATRYIDHGIVDDDTEALLRASGMTRYDDQQRFAESLVNNPSLAEEIVRCALIHGTKK